MNIETLQQYCLSKKGVTEETPFGPDNLVYKVGGKMFLLASLDTIPLRFNAKCDPEEAIQLRDTYPCVLPGYHMNKKHWNTVIVDGSVGDKTLQQWIDASYALVFKCLPKQTKEEILGYP
ncbi:MmcQ/YjbR family DNA-binding protein [Flavisolibacter sp. BT320]|jgi:predicted DNA-binding protein (MmcQ/YjbR family)|nr:MmcQ/YjbR family DNA-binding protein [Flavisolibacter longurius]